MLQITAAIQAIGKVGKFIILGMIALALIVVTVKGTSMYYSNKQDKDLAKAVTEVKAEAKETIRQAEEVTKTNVETVKKATDAKIETVEKKATVDKIITDFVRETEKVQKEKPVSPKPVTVSKKDQIEPSIKAPSPVVIPITEVSPKVKVLMAYSDLMDNEISNLPALV